VLFKGFYNGYGPFERGAKRFACASARLHSDIRPGIVCDICKTSSARLERHSEDYSKPYDPNQFFLCRSCHRFWLHGRFSNPSRWLSYKKQLRKGNVSKDSEWWEALSSSPDTRWSFDARPRANSEQMRAFANVFPDCNALQIDILRELVSLTARRWTVRDIARRLRTKHDPSISKAIDGLCVKLCSEIGYHPPTRANDEKVSFFVLVRPDAAPTDQHCLADSASSWHLHRSTAAALTALIGLDASERHSEVLGCRNWRQS